MRGAQSSYTDGHIDPPPPPAIIRRHPLVRLSRNNFRPHTTTNVTLPWLCHRSRTVDTAFLGLRRFRGIREDESQLSFDADENIEILL